MVWWVITSFTDETTAYFFVGINSTVRSSKFPKEPTLNYCILTVRGIITNYFYVRVFGVQ